MDAKDIIGRLLVYSPTKRLGCLNNGTDDIKNHSFFNTIKWEELYHKEIKAPWIPHFNGPDDMKYFENNEDENEQMIPYYGDCSWADEF